MKALVEIWSSDVEFHLLANHIFTAGGFDTVLSDDVEEVLRLAHQRRPFAVVLDCRADSSTMAAEICVRLKGDPETAEIFAVAVISQDAGDHYLELLKAGFDETCMRPLAPSRLLDFLRARLRREDLAVHRSVDDAVLRYEGIEMNLATMRVQRNGTAIHLAPIEFRMLRLLMEKPEQVVNRDELIAAAWPTTHYVEDRTVDVHVGRLRKFLKGRNDSDVIRTVRGVGYALDAKADGD
ncbi:transcriptional regulator, winged helix family [Rhizobium sp. CF080]|uniref:winged helix-turn-helix transcriptional regulator n=1 Tax=Rhizobium sp. (strain CF080) TaxID=1144310 RepID=UPI0002715E7D|nr:response regulator transcription factor [Rhizobium sp. CF080]EUB98298.1 transcriptional regulator, winged helix family [Rhizobium sp. CF080]